MVDCSAGSWLQIYPRGRIPAAICLQQYSRKRLLQNCCFRKFRGEQANIAITFWLVLHRFAVGNSVASPDAPWAACTRLIISNGCFPAATGERTCRTYSDFSGKSTPPVLCHRDDGSLPAIAVLWHINGPANSVRACGLPLPTAHNTAVWPVCVPLAKRCLGPGGCLPLPTAASSTSTLE